jgi:AraC family transcriptional regulator
MKKTTLSLLFVFALAAFGLGQEVQFKDQNPFAYAYLECTGPYSQMSAKIGEFMNAYMSQGLGSFSGIMAVYLNMPAQVPEAELKWRIGMPIGKEAVPAAPLQKAEFNYAKVAVATHVGPYERVHETYAKMMAYLEKNGWKIVGPPYEMYLDNPEEVAPEKLRTEITMPVEKK